MIERIRQLWWLILAWLLAMFGTDFWDFNVMELFATIAIIVGVGIAIYKSRQDKQRQRALVQFPDDWLAKVEPDKGIVKFTASANVLVHHYSYGFDVAVFAEGKKMRHQNLGMASPIGRDKEGRKTVWVEIPVSQIPKGINELQANVRVRLDGKFIKDSGRRTCPIVGISSLAPDKEGSQT